MLDCPCRADVERLSIDADMVEEDFISLPDDGGTWSRRSESKRRGERPTLQTPMKQTRKPTEGERSKVIVCDWTLVGVNWVTAESPTDIQVGGAMKGSCLKDKFKVEADESGATLRVGYGM